MAQEAFVVRKGEAETLRAPSGPLQFLCGPEHTDGVCALMENTVLHGAGPPPHFHAWAEAYYLISGQMEFVVDGNVTTASSGDFVYVPGGVIHAFRGASEEPARMLVFSAPAHSVDFFREMHREIREMPRDLPKLRNIGLAHGVHLVAPA